MEVSVERMQVRPDDGPRAENSSPIDRKTAARVLLQVTPATVDVDLAPIRVGIAAAGTDALQATLMPPASAVATNDHRLPKALA